MKYATYAAYQFPNHEKGEILSIHATYRAANKKAKGNTFAGIREVPDSAKRGENVRKYDR